VHSYRRERQGLLFGTRTAGAVSAASAFVMPGGSLLYLAVAGLEVDGEVIEGHGIEPDRQIARPLPYAHGGDPALDGALEYLLAPASTPALEAPARGTLP
jgi:carboxyl-terminal processing protease